MLHTLRTAVPLGWLMPASRRILPVPCHQLMAEPWKEILLPVLESLTKMAVPAGDGAHAAVWAVLSGPGGPRGAHRGQLQRVRPEVRQALAGARLAKCVSGILHQMPCLASMFCRAAAGCSPAVLAHESGCALSNSCVHQGRFACQMPWLPVLATLLACLARSCAERISIQGLSKDGLRPGALLA